MVLKTGTSAKMIRIRFTGTRNFHDPSKALVYIHQAMVVTNNDLPIFSAENLTRNPFARQRAGRRGARADDTSTSSNITKRWRSVRKRIRHKSIHQLIRYPHEAWQSNFVERKEVEEVNVGHCTTNGRIPRAAHSPQLPVPGPCSGLLGTPT
jgi:hypothetical protein